MDKVNKVVQWVEKFHVVVAFLSLLKEIAISQRIFVDEMFYLAHRIQQPIPI